MPVDSDFGKIQLQTNRSDKVAGPSKWVNMVETAQPSNPFEVVYLQHPCSDTLMNNGKTIIRVLDFKTALNPLLRPSGGNVRTIYEIVFTKFRNPQVDGANHFDGNGLAFNLLKRNYTHAHLTQEINNARQLHAPGTFLPISEVKLANITKLCKKIKDKDQVENFYNSIPNFHWPVDENSDDDEEQVEN